MFSENIFNASLFFEQLRKNDLLYVFYENCEIRQTTIFVHVDHFLKEVSLSFLNNNTFLHTFSCFMSISGSYSFSDP